MSTSLLGGTNKAGQQAASTANSESQASISQIEQYLNKQNASLRTALSGLGPNPYFGAASDMSPAGYQVNPLDSVTFGGGTGAAPTAAPSELPATAFNGAPAGSTLASLLPPAAAAAPAPAQPAVPVGAVPRSPPGAPRMGHTGDGGPIRSYPL